MTRTSSSDGEAVARNLLNTLARLRGIARELHSGAGAEEQLVTFQESIERGILLNPKMINKLFAFLLDLEHTLQQIYLDARYRTPCTFNASLDLSEIFAYTMSSPWREWAEVVRFSIERQPETGRFYHVLPTTIIEVLGGLRRFLRSCDAYGDYRVLRAAMSARRIETIPDPRSSEGLTLKQLADTQNLIPYREFLQTLVQSKEAHGSQGSKEDPAVALLHLFTRGTIRPIDDELKELLADDGERVAQFEPQYDTLFSRLNVMRSKTHLRWNNSIDARSYQLSLALNDRAREEKKLVYLPILSSGIPLNEFTRIGWEMDPAWKRVNLAKDPNVDVKDSRLFSTARGRNYHYLSTILSVKHGKDKDAIADAAASCSLEVKSCIDEWADTVKALDTHAAQRSVTDALRLQLLRLRNAPIESEVLEDLENSRRRRIEDVQMWKDWALFRGPKWIRQNFSDQDSYQRILDANYVRARNQVMAVFGTLSKSLDLFVELERGSEDKATPELVEVVEWADKFVR